MAGLEQRPVAQLFKNTGSLILSCGTERMGLRYLLLSLLLVALIQQGCASPFRVMTRVHVGILLTIPRPFGRQR